MDKLSHRPANPLSTGYTVPYNDNPNGVTTVNAICIVGHNRVVTCKAK